MVSNFRPEGSYIFNTLLLRKLITEKMLNERWLQESDCAGAAVDGVGMFFPTDQTHLPFVQEHKGGKKHPQQTQASKKRRVGGNRASKLPQSLNHWVLLASAPDRVNMWLCWCPGGESLSLTMQPRRSILIPDCAAQEENPYPRSCSSHLSSPMVMLHVTPQPWNLINYNYICFRLLQLHPSFLASEAAEKHFKTLYFKGSETRKQTKQARLIYCKE